MLRARESSIRRARSLCRRVSANHPPPRLHLLRPWVIIPPLQKTFRVILAMMMAKEAQTLSLERKLRMHEARETLLDKVVSATFSVIDLEHFLQATVNEVGKIM